MSTQDILAIEEVTVNGTHSVNTESLCVLKETGVNTTLFDWYTHRYLCVNAGFSCVRLCQEFSSVEKVTLITCLQFFNIKSKVCTILFYTM